MCYFVYLGIQDRLDTKGLTNSGVEVEPVRNLQLPPLPRAFVWRAVTEAGCSCSLFKKPDVEGLERKSKAGNWSVAKSRRAIKDHLSSTGLDARVSNWIAGSVTKREPIYLVVNWVGEPIKRTEAVLDSVRVRSAPGMVRPNVLFKIVPTAV